MSTAIVKPILWKIVGRTESPIPRILLVTDSAEVCGRGIIYALVKSHASAGSRIQYLTTAISPRKIQTFIENNENITYHDGYSDPCGWEKRDSCIHLDDSLDGIFNTNVFSGERNSVLVIDKLDDLYDHQDPLRITRSLHKLGTEENLEQLIIYCSRDCVSEQLSSLCHIATASIHIKPSSPLQCKIVSRKPSGKVLQNNEEFTLTPELGIKDNRLVEKVKIPIEGSNDADVILAAQTTFNLSLTDDQRRSKNNLLLPHTRIQNSGGQIHYTPDDVDDWDEEDPDDDLDI